MQRILQLSVLVAIAAIGALMITFPAAYAGNHHHHHHHHGVSIKIHQSIDQDQSCAFANCQQNAANVAQVGHGNIATVNQTNIH